MGSRVFTAITVNDCIARIGQQAQARLTTNARLVHRQDFHITLIPPITVASPDELAGKLSVVVDGSDPFVLRSDCLSLVPEGAQARMLWLKFHACPELLRLRNSLLEVSAMKPSKNFVPHITLARLSWHSPIKADELSKHHRPIQQSLAVNKIHLLESTSNRPVRYQRLRSFGLGRV